jgi:hypothetical protein
VLAPIEVIRHGKGQKGEKDVVWREKDDRENGRQVEVEARYAEASEETPEAS